MNYLGDRLVRDTLCMECRPRGVLPSLSYLEGVTSNETSLVRLSRGQEANSHVACLAFPFALALFLEGVEYR
jgi:hypothetical protein